MEKERRKKRIGILTFHHGANHGAYLQAMSLSKFIADLGFDVEVIDYRNPSHVRKEVRRLVSKNIRKWRRSIFLLKKYLYFRRWIKKLPLSKKVRSAAEIECLKYDAIVYGSDVIWDFKSGFWGGDTTYFGEGLNSSPKISYAPSFGTMARDEALPDNLVNILSSYRSLSVRDDISKEIIVKNVGVNPTKVLDPSLLMEGKLDDGHYVNDKYILVYSHSTPDFMIDEVRKMARSRNCRIISVGYYNSWCDTNWPAVSPERWLSLIKNASCIITSTFHGTLYSIIYRKEFLVLGNKTIENKLYNFLSDMGCLDRYITRNNVIGDLDKILESKIDYQNIQNVIVGERSISAEYLTKSLYGVS